MKGIILAGGAGTRLHPMTVVACKQLLPVYDRPMICYPLATLTKADIRDILLITTPQDLPAFKRLLGDGSAWDCSIQYAIQEYPAGIAQAFLVGREFIGGDRVAMILGDNLFFDPFLPESIERAKAQASGATIFAKSVPDPKRYGVVEFGPSGEVRSIVEKPLLPKTNCAVTGLYFYDNQVMDIAVGLKPSPRGELEISDVNNEYLARGQLAAERLSQCWPWFDCGTPESLLDAAVYVRGRSIQA